jgi:hypothetical protein
MALRVRIDHVALAALFTVLIARPADAPATVAEQRARLPPAAECDDPITGAWRGLTWYPDHGAWFEFTLEIQRTPGKPGELAGSILAHFWDGVPEVSEPGACTGPGKRVVVRQPAVGTFDGKQVSFRGTSWKVERVICGSWSGPYIVEQFVGTLEPERQEFQSVNDWSPGHDDEEPTVFRRIRCADLPSDGPVEPRSREGTAAPPPFQPPKQSGC